MAHSDGIRHLHSPESKFLLDLFPWDTPSITLILFQGCSRRFHVLPILFQACATSSEIVPAVARAAVCSGFCIDSGSVTDNRCFLLGEQVVGWSFPHPGTVTICPENGSMTGVKNRLSSSFSVAIINPMKIDSDPVKDAINQQKHGVSLAVVSECDWSAAISKPDQRSDYGERRMNVPINSRLYCVVFVDRGAVRRVISLRKANSREVKAYVQS
ncbi:MAG: BrnT family toxin [Magnetococcus sp. YQC-9]